MKNVINPICPHCGRIMDKEDLPAIGYEYDFEYNFESKSDFDFEDSESDDDEFVWESPFLWICINNACPLFVNGWKHMAENHGQLASVRYMVQPHTGESGVIAASNPDTLTFLIKEKKKTQGLQT